ncbi:zf-TFIIB domain-containing protein (plasmid) [Pontibacillus sp. ALD_SL1]|uniref:transposase n=1 Tax=Pontibacillus sp. ALD_SL1 TaxID=2777185 RepID=UPI001A976A4A|nr:transposase [Pontibacillus sp. ALD_SL1]QST02498.1 zf-TFIIB domain-containing protein [Pontibacillus sp. ALD_SL1]
MSHKDTMLHRMFAQNGGITISAQTKEELTFGEAKKMAESELFPENVDPSGFQPFVVLPLATKERWENRSINFCPRCGSSLKDYELDSSASFTCYECDTSMSIAIAEPVSHSE